MLGIGGWLNGDPPWFAQVEQAALLLAPLVGARPDEVTLGASTTVNLHQLLATLYRPAGNRTRILMDGLAFPTDRYAVASQFRLRGRNPQAEVTFVPPRDGLRMEEDDLIQAMRNDVAIVLLPSVVYTTGQLLDIPLLTDAAHRHGCMIGFDCSHSAGLIPHRLSEWDVDFAFWCGYKYLNGGPGAAAGLFLNRKHFSKGPGLAGWFSSNKERQFDMADELIPADDAAALQMGTPPILSLAPLLGSLKMINEAGIERVRAKSLSLTRYLMEVIDGALSGCGFRYANPVEDERRGGHVALAHENAAGICAALKSRGVVPDFRPPNIVRLAPAPLYNTYGECFEAVARLKCIMEERAYERFPAERGLVA
jgi:kynureninase